ncbi:hypothetical protein DPMN_138690, partial [Dreissena polymorpha]
YDGLLTSNLTVSNVEVRDTELEFMCIHYSTQYIEAQSKVFTSIDVVNGPRFTSNTGVKGKFLYLLYSTQYSKDQGSLTVVNAFIKEIIKETFEQLKDKLLGNVIRRIEILESDVFEHKREIDLLKQESAAKKNKQIEELKTENEALQRTKADDSISHDEFANNTEQYSRRNNLRIAGVPEDKGAVSYNNVRSISIPSTRTPTEPAREQEIIEKNIESLENLLDAISSYIPTAEEVDDWREDVQNLTKTILNHKDVLKFFYREV